MKRDTRQAAKAFEDFTGARATKVKTVRLDDQNVTGWRMGPVVGVAYEATRDGKTRQYFHEFKKTAKPELVARSDGKQLYITGGRYKVTDRGIEDMPQLFVVNPSRRAGAKRKSRPMARRRRSSVRRRRATRQVAVFRANPVRRRRRRTSTRRRSFRANPIRRVARRRRSSVRRFRRNPSARGVAVNFGKMLLPAAGIGLGAVGSEIIMGYLPIPASFKTGVMRHVTKGVVGIAAGMLVGKVLRQKRLGNYLALGAVVIAVHDAVKEVIASRMPGVPFGQYTRVPRSAFAGMGYVNPGTLGQYTPVPATQFAGDSTQRGVGGETMFNV